MKRLRVSETEVLLEPLFTAALARHGYSLVGLKSEPLTYTRPLDDGLSNIVRFLVNGWDTSKLYLTIVIGVNEPRIATQFIHAAQLGGVSHETLELCGGLQLQRPTDSNERALWHWPLVQESDFNAIAGEAVDVAMEQTQIKLAGCQTMQGLYETLKNYKLYPNIRNFDDNQMTLLISIIEHMRSRP